MTTRRRCIVLFTRGPLQDGAAKGMKCASPLFEIASRRIEVAARALPGVDLLVPPQRGATFGERLAGVFRQARALGYDQVVAVPADTPGLSERHLRETFERLDTTGVVLGPAPDGGVYLIGLGVTVDTGRLFRSVRWRTAHVLADLRASAPGAFILRESLEDLDSPRDLRRLLDEPELDAEIALLVRSLLSTASRAFAPPGRMLLPAGFLTAPSPRGPPAPIRV